MSIERLLKAKLPYWIPQVTGGATALLLPLPALLQWHVYRRPAYGLMFLGEIIFVWLVLNSFRFRKLLLLPLVVVSIVVSGFIVMFGRLPGSFDFMAIYDAAPGIAFPFLRRNAGGIFLAAGAIAIFSVCLALCDKLEAASTTETRALPEAKLKRWCRRVLALMILLAAVVFLFGRRQELLSAYPFGVLAETLATFRLEVKSNSYATCHPRIQGTDATTRPAPSDMVAVLVIGESARRDMFGFANTVKPAHSATPALDRLAVEKSPNMLSFPGYYAVGQSTVPNTLAMMNPFGVTDLMYSFDHPNLLHFFTWGGYAVDIMQNHNCRMVEIYLSPGKECPLPPGNDDARLLPVLAGLLKERGRRLVVIRTIGSHISLYGGGVDREARIHAYRETVQQTDRFLDELFGMVLRLDKPACAWYVSDHGENLGDNQTKEFGHGEGNLTLKEIEVPSVVVANDAFILWADDAWRHLKSNRQKTLTHSALPHTLLGLFGLCPARYYQAESDASSPLFKENADPLLVTNSMIITSCRAVDGFPKNHGRE